MELSAKFRYKGFLPNHNVLGCLEGSVRFLRADLRASVVMGQSPYFEVTIPSLKLCPGIRRKPSLEPK